MSQRYIGSSISPTAAPTSSTSTTGVWSINDQYQAKNAGNWPLYEPPPTNDPYFQYVSMLLPGNGTNGAQNNTFLDSSTNNFAITRTGNTTQGTFSPYGANWSILTTSGNTLLSPTNSAFTFAGNFTIECWCFNSGSGTPQIFSDWSTGSFAVLANGTSGFYVYLASTTPTFIVTDKTLSIGVWTHVALVRSGSTVKLYVNGIASSTTATNSATLGNGTMSPGSNTTSGIYISNFRVNTTAVYTANFTPSTTPLTAIAGTVSLIAQSNRVVDNGPLNLAWTRQGNPIIQRFSPFSPATVTPYYSAYFDGSGDYLSMTNNAAFNLDTGDFTLELWANHSNVGQVQSMVSNYTGASNGWLFQWRSDTTRLAFGLGDTQLIYYTFTPVVGAWYHYAVTRSGTSLRMFINGALVATVTNSSNLTSTGATYIGNINNAISQYTYGYLSNVRIVKGTAVYTSAFTPPTAPLTAVSGTSLLTCQSSTFIDNSSNAFPITVTGNSRPIETAPFTPTATSGVPYSAATIGGSGYFDGSGDYLSIPNSSQFSFGTGDFTVEYWVNYSSFTSTSSYFGVSCWSSNNGFELYHKGSSGFAWYYMSSTLTTGIVPTPNTWYHLAVTRSSGTTRFFVNGVLANSILNDTSNFAPTATMYLGIEGGTTGPLNGYLSNVRIIKGTAAYTANFAPPVAPVTAITNTSLLVNGTNAGIIDNAEMNDLETVGNAQISTTQSKFGGSSISFDGTGDYLTTPNPAWQTDLFKSTNDWTLEFWFYTGTSSGTMGLVDTYYSNSAPYSGLIVQIINGTINVYDGSSNKATTTTYANSAWHHFAWVNNGGTSKVYIDGTNVTMGGVTSWSTPSNIYRSNVPLQIGRDFNPYYFNGYIDDFRITQGYARYTANFTPSTSAFPTA